MNLKETNDKKVLFAVELTNEHLFWCIEGMINKAEETDLGYDQVRDFIEPYKAGAATIKLSPLHFEDHDIFMLLHSKNIESEEYDVYSLLPKTIASAIIQAMQDPQWDIWKEIASEGDQKFGEGNWSIDWHMAKPLENEEAVLGFILQGVRKEQ